jgi:adenylate cyclase
MATRAKLAVIVHADVVGSTALVRKDESLAHDRIQAAFQKFSQALQRYGGTVHEIRGDALVAEFSRASDAVLGVLAAQQRNAESNIEIADEIVPQIRVGIALGEVVIADDTLTGAGVVLAQRLEQLAGPGGVCISAAVREAVPDRLAVDYSDLGAQEAKGFDERVVAYSVSLEPGEVLPEPTPAVAETGLERLKWRWFAAVVVAVTIVAGGFLSWLQPWRPDVERADLGKMVYPLPDVPSIAVLPFDNMSTDKEQEYFADGITEDIITDLSKISGLFVVARNSTFTYKDTPVEVRKVAEDLGVRYVLEGSVRRSADKIRITAQLIDAVKGDHLWAERYDRDLESVFSVQLEVAQQVARALAVTLTANENERLFQKYTTNIEAYDVFLKARRTVDALSRRNVERGEKLFTEVIELDPKFAGGYAGLSFNHSVKARLRFGDSRSADIARSFELATEAVDLDSSFAWGYIALAGAHLANGDANAAVNAARQALVLQPNGYEANLFMGFYLQFAGEPALAVEHLKKAKRLSPVDTVRNLAFLGFAHFMNRNYAEAVRIFTKRIHKFPMHRPLGRVILAASHTLLGQPIEAAAVVKELRAAHPKFTLSEWGYIKSWKSEENRLRLYNAAKQAGIPEFPNRN